MKHFLLMLAIVGGVFASIAAFAGERSVSLEVPMSCPTCPYLVQNSLERIAGVRDVAVSYAKQTATVQYDDEKTTVSALAQATADIGFPARVLSSD